MYSRIFIFLCCIFLYGSSLGQTPKLFDSDELLELELICDLTELQADRGMEPEYHDAVLSGKNADGSTYEMKVQVKARGNFRRSDLTCKFPPLRVRFSKNDTLGPFEADRKLKLVTHCDEERFILREYMVYKTYNVLSEWSLGVRLCRITYIDKYEKMEPETHFAFFIEDMEHFGERKNGKEIDTTRIKAEILDRDQLTFVHVFQYMIGNPDHSVERFKNTKVIGHLHGGEAPIPVPYDFDWSGVVDAPYTKLTGETTKTSQHSKQRFKPLCRTDEEFQAVFSVFLDKKEEIFSLYENSPFLEEEDKKYCLDYYKSFYSIIKRAGKAKKVFVTDCE